MECLPTRAYCHVSRSNLEMLHQKEGRISKHFPCTEIPSPSVRMLGHSILESVRVALQQESFELLLCCLLALPEKLVAILGPGLTYVGLTNDMAQQTPKNYQKVY